MKIVIINGQNHRGSTYHIGRMLADKLAREDEIEELFLPKDMPHLCCGCTQCFMKDEKLCPHYEVVKPITDLLDAADLLIFTTPVYVMHATASMKALLDHYGYRFMVHRPEEKMFKKQAVCIATAAGSGFKGACKDIKDSLFYWGVGKIYCYGLAVGATSWKGVSAEKKVIIQRKTDSLAGAIKKRVGNVKAPLKTKAMFHLMRQLQRRGWSEVDINYWKERGWDKSRRPWHS